MIWQPAETAPDNTPVLIFNGKKIAVGRKTTYTRRSVWWIDDSFGFNEDGEIYHVSHWMPLPEPPDASPR